MPSSHKNGFDIKLNKLRCFLGIIFDFKILPLINHPRRPSQLMSLTYFTLKPAPANLLSSSCLEYLLKCPKFLSISPYANICAGVRRTSLPFGLRSLYIFLSAILSFSMCSRTFRLIITSNFLLLKKYLAFSMSPKPTRA